MPGIWVPPIPPDSWLLNVYQRTTGLDSGCPAPKPLPPGIMGEGVGASPLLTPAGSG